MDNLEKLLEALDPPFEMNVQCMSHLKEGPSMLLPFLGAEDLSVGLQFSGNFHSQVRTFLVLLS